MTHLGFSCQIAEGDFHAITANPVHPQLPELFMAENYHTPE